MLDKTHRLLKSKVHRKIMLFFEESEGSIDTPRGICAWIDEGLASVRVALEDLVLVGWLKAHRTSSTIGYSCVLNKKALTELLSTPKK